MNLCFTVATINYIKNSMLVRDSFLTHNPDWRFIILVADMISDRNAVNEMLEYRKKGAEFVFFTEILPKCQDYPVGEVASSYGSFEIAASLKAFGFRHFFNLGWKKVFYVDSDMKFYNSVSEALHKLDEYDAVLTPHMMSPYPDDGMIPKNIVRNVSGLTNTGFVAINNTDDGNKLVDFWMRCLKNKDNRRIDDGKVRDQFWTVWFPYLSDKVCILKDMGYNVSYWNLHERGISRKEGVWFSNDRPLVFFHFAGLLKDNPECLSKHQTRYKLSDFSDDLKDLFYDYIDDLNSRSSCLTAKMPRFSSYLPNTDFAINDSMFLQLLSICRNDGYSHLSADIDSELFIARRIADRAVYVKPRFGFDVAGSFSCDNGAYDFLVRFLSLGIFFSILDISEPSFRKRPYLEHFYARRTNNPGIIFFISDASASHLLDNGDILSGKTMKIAVISDNYTGSDDDLKNIISGFDRIVALSEGVFNRVTENSDIKTMLIEAETEYKLPASPDGPDYNFTDRLYGFLSDLDIGTPEAEGNMLFCNDSVAESSHHYKKLNDRAKKTEDSYKEIDSLYKQLQEKYKRLESSYHNLDNLYKNMENSVSYRLGRLLTYPAAFIKGIFAKR